MKRNLVIALFILGVIMGGYYFYVNRNNSINPPANSVNKCEKLDSQTVQSKVKIIKDGIDNYVVNSKDIIGKSLEGGIQKNYLLNNVPVLIEQAFYGETGKSEVAYYLQDGKVFYINKKNITYTVPLSQDISGEVKDTELKDFYLDSDQVLCYWYSDGELQSNDKDSKDLVEFLITGL